LRTDSDPLFLALYSSKGDIVVGFMTQSQIKKQLFSKQRMDLLLKDVK
jgi:hypothetical protein